MATEEEDIFLQIRDDVVETILLTLPKRTQISLIKLGDEMKNQKDLYKLSDFESAWLAYKWTAQNININCSQGFITKKVNLIDGVYSSGTGSSDGIALLFSKICDFLDLKAEYITGIVKETGSDLKTSFTQAAWNSIKINSKIYLFDAALGAGKCSGNTFVQKFNKNSFCVIPETFIRNHFPDADYQYLDEEIDSDTFSSISDIGEAFYNAGFLDVKPSSAIIRANKKIEISLSYSSKKSNLALSAKLYYGKNTEEEKNVVMVYKYDKKFVVITNLNKKGEYILKLFFGTSETTTFSPLLSYKIITSETNEPALYFPTLYASFIQSDMKLISPESSPLIRGSRVDFKIETTSFTNLYVYDESGLYTELTKSSNIFQEEDIFIAGKAVSIVTKDKNTGKFQIICTYDTIEDPTSSESVSFPRSYSVIKNTLISPIKDRLRIGNTYDFKVRCKECNGLAVIQGESTSILKKEDDIFSGSVKIIKDYEVMIALLVDQFSAIPLYTYGIYDIL